MDYSERKSNVAHQLPKMYPCLQHGCKKPLGALDSLSIGIAQFANHPKAPKVIPDIESTSFKLKNQGPKRAKTGKRSAAEREIAYDLRLPFSDSKRQCSMSQKSQHSDTSDESESTLSDSTGTTSFTTEEAASELLKLNQGDSPIANNEEGNESSASTHWRPKRRKACDLDKKLKCGFCSQSYGSMSALTLHIRTKHVDEAKQTLGLNKQDALQPIHARSLSAYFNNCMNPRHVAIQHSNTRRNHFTNKIDVGTSLAKEKAMGIGVASEAHFNEQRVPHMTSIPEQFFVPTRANHATYSMRPPVVATNERVVC